MNLLLVDDEMPAIRSTIQILNESGIKMDAILTAYSFSDAAEQLRRHHVDIVITDIKMRNGSGLDLVKWINDENINCVKIILSSYPDFSFAQTAISQGVSEYLLKPVSRERLISALHKAIKQAETLGSENTPDESVYSESESLIYKTKEYIEKNIATELSRKDIAKELGISVDYLSRLFRKETGFSLTDYIKNARIIAAQKMLDNTNLSISIIGEYTGYKTFSYFSSIFKKEVGMTPYEYRNRRK